MITLPPGRGSDAPSSPFATVGIRADLVDLVTTNPAWTYVIEIPADCVIEGSSSSTSRTLFAGDWAVVDRSIPLTDEELVVVVEGNTLDIRPFEAVPTERRGRIDGVVTSVISRLRPRRLYSMALLAAKVSVSHLATLLRLTRPGTHHDLSVLFSNHLLKTRVTFTLLDSYSTTFLNLARGARLLGILYFALLTHLFPLFSNQMKISNSMINYIDLQNLPAGKYIYRLRAGSSTRARTMIVGE